MSTAAIDVSIEQLYRDNFSKVYNYVHGRFPSFLPEEVEDVVQETFLRVCRAPERVRVEMAGGWLCYVARNVAIDALRKKQVSLKRDTGFPFDELAGRSDGHDLQEEYTRQEPVRAALACLSEEHQRILVLAVVEGYSRKDIGILLGKSEHAIKMHLYRARRAFKLHYRG
jgi:RNA polymerase sigma-70 factor, ECF subfamily